MSCSTGAAAKKVRTPTPYQPCWCCSESIGDLCDGQLESFMAAIVNSCRFMRYGYDETLQYTKKRGHEETCEHTPFDSPFGAVAATQACNSTSRTHTCGDLIHIFLHISLRLSYSHFSPFIIYKLICCLHISIGISYSDFSIGLQICYLNNNLKQSSKL